LGKNAAFSYHGTASSVPFWNLQTASRKLMKYWQVTFIASAFFSVAGHAAADKGKLDEGHFTFICQLEHFVLISKLEDKTTHFPYDTYLNQRMLLEVENQVTKWGPSAKVSSTGIYWGDRREDWIESHELQHYNSKWDWVHVGEYYFLKFKFGRLTGVSTNPSKWGSNEGYGGRVGFWTAVCSSEETSNK
tara:strand:+ start:374 stop:943 length:570 start_codon:yes stop_codon:yes gene_type:complete